MLHRAQAPGRRVRLGQPRADAGPGQQRGGVPGLGGGQVPGAALLHQGGRLQPGPVQRAGRLPGRARPEPVRVRHHLARRGDHGQPGALAGADHGLDRRPDAQRVRGLPGRRVQRRRPDHAGGPVARAGRAAPAAASSPTATCSTATSWWTRTGSSAWSTSTEFWIPQLAGQSPPTEFGHPNYQHPLHHNWDRWLDTFSALVIYLSLVALGKDPGLWLALYNSKNLLFAKTDFFPPFKTEAWKQLAALRDPQVDELARKLQECCDPLWVSNRSLETTLEQPAAAPALPPVPADQRWWEQRPAPGPGPRPRGPRPRGSRPRDPRPRRRRPGPGRRRPRPPGRPRPRGAAASCTSGPRPRAAPAPRGAAGGRAARPAPAVRAARHGRHRTDAAAEPDDDAAQRHDLVDPAAGRPGPGSGRPRIPRVRCRPRPMPRGYAPHAPVPTPPGPPMPGPAAPAKRTQTGPVVGAVALALGILLLVIGAASHSLHRRDRRSGGRRVGHVAARHRDREGRQAARLIR